HGVGLICVDEEHDASYKQESDPRYDARTVAAKRAALEGAVALYGSATPRPESWERLERLELRARPRAKLPPGPVVGPRPGVRAPPPGGGLPALGPAARRARDDRRPRRQGDPAAHPPRDRSGAPLPRLRDDVPLPALRRRARAPPRRAPALPSLRPRGSRAGR